MDSAGAFKAYVITRRAERVKSDHRFWPTRCRLASGVDARYPVTRHQVGMGLQHTHPLVLLVLLVLLV